MKNEIFEDLLRVLKIYDPERSRLTEEIERTLTFEFKNVSLSPSFKERIEGVSTPAFRPVYMVIEWMDILRELAKCAPDAMSKIWMDCYLGKEGIAKLRKAGYTVTYNGARVPIEGEQMDNFKTAAYICSEIALARRFD